MNAAVNSRKKHQEKKFITFRCVLFKNTMDILLLKLKKKKTRKRIEPIDIVYDPVKNFDNIVNCYFAFHLHPAYSLQYLRGKKELKFCTRFNATHAISFILLKKHLKS